METLTPSLGSNANMKRLASRLWYSPTFTTWGSLATRLMSVMLVLPLVRRATAALVEMPAPPAGR